MKKRDELELSIESYAFEGKGIAKIDKPTGQGAETKKFVVFVDKAYPGDKVLAQIRRVKKSFADANIVKLISPSDKRVEARCKYFGLCGGCKAQDLDYAAQVEYKQEQVTDIFERMGGLTNFQIEPIIPSENIFYYRNKMEFSFADKRWLSHEEINSGEEIPDRNFALGLHIPRIYDKVLDLTECFLQSEVSAKILNFTRDFFKSKETTIYSTKTHTGFLRNLVIKQAFHTKDLMVNLVTSEENENLMKEYTEKLIAEFPEVTTVINNVNTRKAQVAIGDYEVVFHGSGLIYDHIGDYKFRISANSFFQTNTAHADKLYNTALQFAEAKPTDNVYDLYCGAGTISIYFSKSVNKVYGFESVEPAIADANINRELNDVDNTEFIQADLNKSFLPIVEKQNLPAPDIIIADPPRSGMNPKTVNDIINLNPPKIVYVSCNPTTQVRDIKLLAEAGYKLIKIRPVDMFPHTFHIENVALLIKES